MTAPLLLTDDLVVEGQVRRLAAAAGAEVEVLRRSERLDHVWARSPCILVGSDRVADLAGLEPPRRGDVHVVMAPTPAVPPDLYRDALALGAQSVLELPGSSAWLVEFLTDLADGALGSGTVVGVVGGSGGAGSSTFAAALAGLASRQVATVVVDLDPLGAGQDRLLGLDEAVGVRWDGLAATGRLAARSLRQSLPRWHDLAVLAQPPGGATVESAVAREVLSAARRGFDLVVCDLPRHQDDAAAEATARCDRVVMVVDGSVGGLAGAARMRARLPDVVPVAAVVRERGGVSAAEAGRVLDLPVLAAMSDQRRLEESLALGAGPLRSGRGPLARGVRHVLDGLAIGRTR